MCIELKHIELPADIEEINEKAFVSCADLIIDVRGGEEPSPAITRIQKIVESNRNLLVMLCSCGQVHDKPLTVDQFYDFNSKTGAVLAAYSGEVLWKNSDKPFRVKKKYKVWVGSSLCCRVGDTFSFFDLLTRDEIVVFKLLAIRQRWSGTAKVLVKVARIFKPTDFIKPIAAADKERVLKNLTIPEIHDDFNYEGDWWRDSDYECDDQGFLHLFQVIEGDFEGDYAVFGDCIIG